MRIIYVIIIAVLALVLLVALPTWRGPLMPALTVAFQPLEQRIVASGEVRYPSLARIGSEITATVVARHVREGDWVHQGELLIELKSDELQVKLEQANNLLQQLQKVTRPQAQAALIEAQTTAEQAKREARRREALAAKGTLSRELAEQATRAERNAHSLLTRAQLTAASLAENHNEEQLLQLRIKSAEAELARTRIYAPFSGRVQTRDVEPGDVVQPGKVLLEIARQEPPHRGAGDTAVPRDSFEPQALEVVVALDEKSFAPLKLGQAVQLIADAWPEQTVKGEVSFIAPAIDRQRGTLDVHIQILEDPKTVTFLPGMTVSANIITALRPATLVLPNDYLATNAKGEYHVWLRRASKVTAQPVQLGLRNMTHSEIISGLNEGEVVVQAAQLEEGQRVRVQFETPPHVIR